MAVGLGIIIAFGMAAMALPTFVNAPVVPRAAILFLSLLSIMAAYGLGFWFARHERRVSAQGAIIAGLALFGAALFFVASAYHIHIRQPDLVLVWSAGALATALILPSRAALAAAVVLGTGWTLLETGFYGTIFHWPYLVFMAAAFGGTLLLRWPPGLHLSVIGLLYWMLNNLEQGAQVIGWGMLDVGGLLLILWTAMWVSGRNLQGTAFPFPRALQYYGLALSLVTLFAARHIFQFQAPSPTWLVLVCFVSLSVGGAALTAFERERIGLVAAGLTLLTGIVYPFAAPQMTEGLVETQHTLFILFALWTVYYGFKRRDAIIATLGLLAWGAEAVSIYTGITGAPLTDPLSIGLSFLAAAAGLGAGYVVYRRFGRGELQ